jgi:hypothetical protein
MNLKDETHNNNNNNNKSNYDKEKKRDQYDIDNDEEKIKPKMTGPKQSQVDRFEREDHRLAGNRFGKGTSMADRLNVHIKKDSNDVPYPEESKLEAPSLIQPVTPLKFHSKTSTSSPDMEDIEVLNLDAISTKKLRLRNRRNKNNNRDNYDDDDNSNDDNSDDDYHNGDNNRADEKKSKTPESIPLPLRRARDETNDVSMSKRTSIDDLLHVQGSLSFKDDPGSPILDLKAEKEMRSSYQNNNSSVAEAKSVTNTSKPPRPPNPKPPYAQKAKIQINENNNGIASSIVDKNFVNEDWDETKQPKINIQGPGVQADPNWLDEDFDD